jgi:UDP-glucose 4-epimerase
MSILVTGGAGFIGSHLVRALLARSWEVFVMDDFSASDSSSLDGLSGKLNVYGGSVTDPRLLAAVMRHDVTHVVHLATRNITVSETDPAQSFAVNAGGMVGILREAARHHVHRVVFTSTTSVYGDDQMPAFEHYSPKPRTVSSIAKYAAELCGAASEVPLNILRLSNVYGPGQSDRANPYCGVIGHFMRAAIADKPMVVYGDGSATRDYTYIDDVIQALVAAIVQEPSGDVFNVSTGQETSTNDLAGMVARVTGKKPAIEHISGRSIDIVKRRVVDSSKFQAAFGWRPSVDLEEGLARTWEWWKCLA